MKIVEIDQIRLVQPGLTVLITSSYDGNDALMAAAWISPVSYIPPRIAVAISPERYTYDVVRNSGMFAVNIMEFKYVDSVCKAGILSGRDYRDKFLAVGLSRSRGYKLPIVTVKEAVGVVECKVLNVVPAGDHDIFIGDVVIAYVNKDDAYNTHWDIHNYEPILYISEGHFITVSKDSLKKYQMP